MREVTSDGAGVAMWAHDLAPLDSEPGIIDGGLNFLNVANFLSCVEFSSISILAVLDMDDGLI